MTLLLDVSLVGLTLLLAAITIYAVVMFLAAVIVAQVEFWRRVLR